MLKLLLGQFAVLLALLVLLDAMLWLVAPMSFSDTSVWLHQNVPGLKPKVKYTTVGGDLRSLTLSSLRKPSGSLRVLCLGASTTEQSTQSVEDTWCAILERELKSKHPDWDGVFHTLSHGAGGNRALNSHVWLNERIDEIQPDVVITLLGINDLAWSGGPGYTVRDVDEALAEGPEGKPDNSISTQLNEQCKSVSQLCRRANLAWANYVLDGEKEIEWHSDNLPHLRAKRRNFPAVDDVTRDPDPFEEFEVSIRRLLKLLHHRGVEVIVLGQPVLWKPKMSRDELDALWFPVNTAGGPVRPSSKWLLAELRRYNDLQRKVANQYDMPFVDLDAKIPKDLEHYFDDCHYTDKGSRAVAEAVLPSLERIIACRVQPANSSSCVQ